MARKNKANQKNDALTIAAVLLVFFLIISFGGGFGYMSGWMFLGPLFMILLLVLIVWLMVSLIQGSRK